MLTYILGGFASLATAIIGVRIYKVYFQWGDYKQMVKEFGMNSIKNMTIIITGCNTGIGKETARELFKHGARIIMANRNKSQTEQLIDEFQKQFPSSNGELIFKKLDLTSMDSVKKFSQDIITNESNVNVLISNAAVWGHPTCITEDGFEINMQINHLAPALLAKLLLPKIQLSSENSVGRIIAVTSTLTKSGKINQEFLSKISNDKLADVPNKAREIYSSSKLANLHFVRCLSRQKKLVKNVEICLASPGFCYTRLHRYTNRSQLIFMSLLSPLFLMIMKSSRQGAQTIIGCSMIRNVRSDVLYHDCKENEKFFQSGIVSDLTLSQNVYDNTLKSINNFM